MCNYLRSSLIGAVLGAASLTPWATHAQDLKPEEIYARLLPRHLEQQIWRALLESSAAELGARMTAMDAATDNATDVIDSLTLHMNKMRQASITKEIIEVVSGASA